ncbi:hypothetical protein [Polaromonas eurypsychrophila]|uniref:hypothetical protein n=1 Tax=Polaromonas eurypsychrophila TaxID=1614635 RepID=UPI001665215D|nr:hypothetical protein [Polaromonas eurypsychrophila]
MELLFFLFFYSVATGYIWLVALVPIFVFSLFVEKGEARGILGILALGCVLTSILTQIARWHSGNTLREEHAQRSATFEQFCADSPALPLVHQVIPVEIPAVLVYANSVEQNKGTSRIHDAHSVAALMRGDFLLCKTRSNLKIRDVAMASSTPSLDLCITTNPAPLVFGHHVEYQLVLSTMSEQIYPATGGSFGPTHFTKASLQLRKGSTILGEDVVHFSDQQALGLRERCPYPEQRLSQLLTNVFQLVEISEPPSNK